MTTKRLCEKCGRYVDGRARVVRVGYPPRPSYRHVTEAECDYSQRHDKSIRELWSSAKANDEAAQHNMTVIGIRARKLGVTLPRWAMIGLAYSGKTDTQSILDADALGLLLELDATGNGSPDSEQS